MVLQQCAHFYNNIATEMIPCQKPMMLAEAVEFEKVQPYLHTRVDQRTCGGALQEHAGGTQCTYYWLRADWLGHLRLNHCVARYM
jgi:hypothetical protein